MKVIISSFLEIVSCFLSVLGDIRTESQRQGTPYQTRIGSILYRYSKGELVDKDSTKKMLKLVKKGAYDLLGFILTGQ